MVFFWSQKPDYTLYTGLDARGTSEATDLLRAAGIPFRSTRPPAGITVPEKTSTTRA
jgi:flagellar M-ring protein FliF